ncbi:MAG: FAD-dependent oxidoreductase, partial [Anaerolineae bacterium]|nr:FAD-dependent oxidoreductase [Anaerolineae bacterium]
MSEKKNVTRREFLKGMAVAGAMAATAGTLVSCQQAMPTGPLPEKWDEEADVVVIGSGFAGLAAAIEAKNAGATVKVLEKMELPGGNSIINGGAIAAAGSPLQAQKGIEDNPDKMLQDMFVAGLYLNHPDLARIVAEKCNEAVQWTIHYLGVEYRDA